MPKALKLIDKLLFWKAVCNDVIAANDYAVKKKLKIEGKNQLNTNDYREYFSIQKGWRQAIILDLLHDKWAERDTLFDYNVYIKKKEILEDSFLPRETIKDKTIKFAKDKNYVRYIEPDKLNSALENFHDVTARCVDEHLNKIFDEYNEKERAFYIYIGRPDKQNYILYISNINDVKDSSDKLEKALKEKRAKTKVKPKEVKNKWEVLFQKYLTSICDDDEFKVISEVFTPIDVRKLDSGGKLNPYLIPDLMVKKVFSKDEERGPRDDKIPETLLSILDCLRGHVSGSFLLVGQPGCGKTTTLKRFIFEKAENAKKEKQTRIPVLISLKYYEKSIENLIEEFLIKHGLAIGKGDIIKFLHDGTFFLIFDGLNELPSQEAMRQLNIFYKKYQNNAPMIFTSRDSSFGKSLGIESFYEIRPLTRDQIEDFANKRLPGNATNFIKQLNGRLFEFARNPLFLLMLCSIYDPLNMTLPSGLGEVFRRFTTNYYERRFKGDAPVSEESKRWWSDVMQFLAFKMIDADSRTGPKIVVSINDAEDIICDYFSTEGFSRPRDRAKIILKELLAYHLIQKISDRQFEFSHQLFQEYYAGGYLLKLFPNFSDIVLKTRYLNYVKWTDTFPFMMALVDDLDQAKRVVKMASKVDLLLAAKLAGSSKREFQGETVSMIAKLRVSQEYKVFLLGETRSDYSVDYLRRYFKMKDKAENIKIASVKALGKVGSPNAFEVLFKALFEENSSIQREALKVFSESNAREYSLNIAYLLLGHGDLNDEVTTALIKIGDQRVINFLIKVLESSDLDKFPLVYAIFALTYIGSQDVIEPLIKVIERGDDYVSKFALNALGKIGGSSAINELKKALAFGSRELKLAAIEGLENVKTQESIDAIRGVIEGEYCDVAIQAAGVLGTDGDKKAIDLLISALNDEAVENRRKATFALRFINENESTELLIHLFYYDDDIEVRINCIGALALRRKYNKKIFEIVIGAIDDKNWEIRAEAVDILGEIHDKSLTDIFVRVLNEENLIDSGRKDNADWDSNAEKDVHLNEDLLLSRFKIKIKIIKLLGKFGGIEASKVLLKELDNEDYFVRARAVEALGDIGDERFIDIFISNLDDYFMDVRNEAIKSLGKIGSLKALSYLKKFLSNANNDINVVSDAIVAIQNKNGIYNDKIK